MNKVLKMKSSNGLNDNNSRQAVIGSYMLRMAIFDSIFTMKLWIVLSLDWFVNRGTKEEITSVNKVLEIKTSNVLNDNNSRKFVIVYMLRISNFDTLNSMKL